MKNNLYYICEYGVIKNISDFESENISTLQELFLPDKSFNSLFNFILENQSTQTEKDPPFSLFIKSKKRQIKVKNYVGIIETLDGTSIEVLPKIHFNKSEDLIDDTKKIFLKMLSHLKDSPFINISNAHLNLKKNFPILEVFIKSFVVEVEFVFANGIKSNYVKEEDNLNFLRGKLIISTNIKKNPINKTKFYCQYTEFSQNNPQNRIIKCTLIKLSKITSSYSNLSSINKVLTYLSKVDESNNIPLDLSHCKVNNRLFSRYKKLLEWSEIFLLNKAFTNFKGASVNVAILFPMERVFEDYIAFLFTKFADAYTVKAQDKSYFLVEKHREMGKFRLKPDLLFDNKNNVERLIIDTKWKLLDETAYGKNYKITSADMYQLFAYGKKYSLHGAQPKLGLIYPRNENFKNKLEPFIYEGDLKLEVIPFNFDNDPENEVKSILSQFLNVPKTDAKVYSIEDELETLAAEKEEEE